MATSNLPRMFFHPALAVALIAIVLSAPEQAIAADDDDSGSQPSEYSLAKQALNDGDYDIAIKKLAQLHENEPKDADVLNLLGYSYRKTGNFDQARSYYLQALAIEPKHRGANEYMGELYLETGELEKAEERLAVLDKDCWFGCSEYTELKESIEEYKAEKGIK